MWENRYPSQAEEPMINPGADAIKHVVVLMLENRSFDHMLGSARFTPGPDQPTVEQPDGTETNPDGSGAPVPISFDAGADIRADPDHSYLGTMLQLTGKPANAPPPPPYTLPYDPNNTGFVQSFEAVCKKEHLPAEYARVIMRCQPAANVPVLATLAREFAVCDHWFGSLPGQTWPNRNYVHAGTSDGEVDINPRTFTNDTIFDRVEDGGKKWRVYHDGLTHLWVFPRLWTDAILRNRFRPMDEFARDAARGDLPAYTFIEPRHFGKSANSQHPDTHTGGRSFHRGEALIKSVYDAITAKRDLWESTLLVITYDEHGGFYDHVPPPQTKITPPDKKRSEQDFGFDMLGTRVPAVLVSPWIARGTVDSTIYDHTVIPRSVRDRFAPKSAQLGKREGASPNFWNNLSLTKARPEPAPPVSLSAEAQVALETIVPLAAVAPQAQALTKTEETYAWLGLKVMEALERESSVGPAAMTSVFWEDPAGRLITSMAEANRLTETPLALAARSMSRAGPVVMTNADRLSAFGQSVAKMMHDSAAAAAARARPRRTGRGR